MGRAYAGILGPLAMAVVICRGWFGSGDAVNTLFVLAVLVIVGVAIGVVGSFLSVTRFLRKI